MLAICVPVFCLDLLHPFPVNFDMVANTFLLLPAWQTTLLDYIRKSKVHMEA